MILQQDSNKQKIINNVNKIRNHQLQILNFPYQSPIQYPQHPQIEVPNTFPLQNIECAPSYFFQKFITGEAEAESQEPFMIKLPTQSLPQAKGCYFDSKLRLNLLKFIAYYSPQYQQYPFQVILTLFIMLFCFFVKFGLQYDIPQLFCYFIQIMTQITLIEEKSKGGKIIYEVQKDGILFLRKLKHKKLRIIFNITYQNINLSQFNQYLFDHQAKQKQRIIFLKQQKNSRDKITYQTEQKNQSNLEKPEESRLQQKFKNRLTIHTHYKEIENNRVIITLNAYQNPESDPYLLILGYLASSAVFYHNYEQKLTHHSNLTQMLNNFQKLLKKTNIDNLNQEIKYKSGFSKTPYFLCIFTGQSLNLSDENIIEQFNNFYHYSQKQEPEQVHINTAVESFVDYFPERSSIVLQAKTVQIQSQEVIFQEKAVSKILQLGRQFQSNILGRQLFNFQFTGTTIQNLCFQMCDCFNNKQNIDLLKTYNKVILNQKSRVFDEAVKMYLDKIAKTFYYGSKIDIEQLNGSSIFPISQFQLTQKHQKIQNQVIKQAFQDALNCMNLQQFKQIYDEFVNKIELTFQKLKTLNLQKGQSFCDECFNILQNISFPKSDEIQNLSNQQIEQCFQCITYKAELFSNQCLGLFAERDTNAQAYNSHFIRLLKNYLQNLSKIICNYVQVNSIQKRQNILEIETLKFDLKKIKSQNKKLAQQYQLQEMIINEYKNKMNCYMKQQKSTSLDSISLTASTNNLTSFNNNFKQFYQMKKKVQELQQEVQDKNNHIDELTQILDRFQTKGYNQKNQFSIEISKLAKNIGQQINKFYTLFEQIKNIQKTYQKAKKGLTQEKQNYLQEKKKDKQQLEKKNKQLEKLIKEKYQLEEIINQEKDVILTLKQVQTEFKQGINKLEIDTGSMSCLMAEKENDLETYKKAAKLLIQQITKGKSQKLLNFYKVTDNEELKDLLKPIVKK